MNNFLDTIKPLVLDRVKHIRDSDTHLSIYESSSEIDFLDIFKQKGPAIVAEIKFASPSRGDIYHGNLGHDHGELDHVAIARSYLKNGASALSVLTEPCYFKGKIDYIRNIRDEYPHCKILLKDFILDEKQIIQGKIYGANAILLIAGFLKIDQLKQLYHFALNLKLTPLIEVHNAQELYSVLPLEPKLIGINNRDLKSLNIDLDISRQLIKEIPKSIYTICESGIDNIVKIQEMQTLGFNGFLIGSSLMQTSDPGLALKAILGSNSE